MKNGPVVRKCFNVARSAQSGLRPLRSLARSRGPAPSLPGEERANGAALDAGPSENTCVRLESWLPINLREFLTAEFRSEIRIEGEAIYFLGPKPEGLFIRELARAIRRFSHDRAQHPWIECAVKKPELEAAFNRRPTADYAAVLCLGCERVSMGAPTEHRAPGCLPLVLGSGLNGSQAQSRDGAGMVTSAGLYGAIEEFRKARRKAGLPHLDLDCYIANGHVVFTWRPLNQCDVAASGNRRLPARQF